MSETPMSVDTTAEATPTNGRSSSGRVRKTTQVFTIVQAKGDEAEDFTPPQGTGAKVCDMAFVGGNLEALGKKQAETLRQLYSVMYGRRYQQKNMKVIKEQILEFSGIPEHEQDEKSREHLYGKICKWKRGFVQEVMDLLAVDRSKKSFDDEGKLFGKEELVDRLIDWLYNPQATKLAEKKAAAAEKAEKRLTRMKAKKAKAKEKKEAAKPAKKKRKTTKKAADVEDDEEEPEASASDGEDSSSDFDEAKKSSKKRKVTRRPRKSQVVESDDEGEENEGNQEADDAAEPEKDEEQPAAEPEKDEEQPAAEPEDDSKDAAKTEVDPLSADVCDKVRDIIAHGNSEELTVKKIVRQLSSDLGRDMSSQKKAIKEFITGDQV